MPLVARAELPHQMVCKTIYHSFLEMLKNACVIAEVKIVAGVLDVNEVNSSQGEQYRNASKITIHPEFDTSFVSDDICMIKVS